MPTAKISINVTGFQDVLTTATGVSRVCVVDNPVLTPDASVAGKVIVVGDTIKTMGPSQINLEFTITPAGTYTPLGIAYIQTADPEASGDIEGSANFDPADLSAKSSHKISVNNKRANKSGSKWKFHIFIQRNTDHLLGIIDPSIENDN